MQQEFFGFDAIKKLKDVISEFDAKNVFLVTGKKSFQFSGAEEKILSVIDRINYFKFNSFSENPNIDEVKRGIALFKKINPDLVVGVGGGSVLDMAKSVNSVLLLLKN